MARSQCGVLSGGQEIADWNPEHLTQPLEVFGRNVFGRTLIGLDPAGIDAESCRQKILAEPQGAALAPNSSANVEINRRHDCYPAPTSLARYYRVILLGPSPKRGVAARFEEYRSPPGVTYRCGKWLDQ